MNDLAALEIQIHTLGKDSKLLKRLHIICTREEAENYFQAITKIEEELDAKQKARDGSRVLDPVKRKA